VAQGQEVRRAFQFATLFGLLPPWGAVGVGVASTGTFAAGLAHAGNVVWAVLAAAYAAAAGLAVLLAVLVRRGARGITPRAEILRLALDVRSTRAAPSPGRGAPRAPAAILAPRIVPGVVLSATKTEDR
jgi:hypothetical protein